MNRSFHAFAVLLVSLAGGMIAATWTATLSAKRPAGNATAGNQLQAKPLYCSCNPDSLSRLEQGCARDKTTGELYGCGLGLGINGASGKSVMGRTANSASASMVHGVVALRDAVAGIPWQEFAAVRSRLSLAESQLAVNWDRMHEQDYAAAELAAAGVDPNQPNSGWLQLSERLAPLYRSISADVINQATQSTVALLESISRRWERQSRLWLVENGLHRQWDAIEEKMMAEQRLTSTRMQFEEADIERWFENFPLPITRPNRLINPIEPRDDSEESRRIILATAKALKTLSGLLHQTAENLTRQAEQDVAELHKLKSGIEERR